MLCALYGGETGRSKEFSVRCFSVYVPAVYYQKPGYFKRLSKGPAIWKTEGEGTFPPKIKLYLLSKAFET